ncbi:MAG: ATP-binding protein [Vulcanimicrobiaceae bacterium]
MRAQTAQDVVFLRIPAKAEWVVVARLALATVASRSDFPIEAIEDIKLAVAEACTNAIAQGDAAGQIEISCSIEQAALRVHVRAPSGAVAGDHRRADGASSGLGLFLIRSLMDTVEFDADASHGMDLVMVKRLSN